MKYSVLMSVYYKETAEHLRTAMESMWHQTVPPDEFILVCDGPLNDSLEAEIAAMEHGHPELKVVRLRENGGLGNALNIGLGRCGNELVARMDSDDISRPDRCEKQLAVFQRDPGVSICSGTVEEFVRETETVEARRVLPEKQEDILRFAKTRNPFNHPCVMYRRTAVEEAGGYRDFYLLEDYYLWIRMFEKGFAGYNLPEPLLWMRAGSEMYSRRAGWKYAKSQAALFRYMRDTGFIGTAQFLKSVFWRVLSSLLPNRLREAAFKHLLRGDSAVIW